MSKDTLLHLFKNPDLDAQQIVLSHHRTTIETTGEVANDPYPFPLDRSREQFEKVIVTIRGSGNGSQVLYRRVR